MLVSGYDCDHAGGIDASLYRQFVVGRTPSRARLPILALAATLARDPIRLLAVRLYLGALVRGHWRGCALPRPTTYRAAHPNLAADVAAIARIAPLRNLEVNLEAVARPVPAAVGPFLTPPRSGFFSTVFAVLVHRFLHGEDAPVNTWYWPYAVPLADLVGGEFIHVRAPADRLDPQRKRIFCDPEAYAAFAAFARGRLASVHERCRAILDRHGILLPPAGVHAVWFVRRGDKLAREAIDVPVAAYVQSIDRLGAGGTAPPLIIGDDDRFIAQIRRARPRAAAFAPFPPLAGSALAAAVGLDRTLAILANFCVLCEARNLVGDAHCNLVAAAMAVRDDDAAADPLLFPWPRPVLV